jgi:uncharacterized membrane protein (UPF0127 family)
MLLSFLIVVFLAPAIISVTTLTSDRDSARLGGVGGAWAKPLREPLTLITANGEKRLSVEVALSAEDKALGLMFRTALSDDSGMLFVYETDTVITMWMKNTYIPLDMVFIRADGVVAHIAVMTEPLSEEIVSSQGPARYVLELAGGAAARLGLRVGDKVRHRLIGAGQ